MSMQIYLNITACVKNLILPAARMRGLRACQWMRQ